jgi:RNA polymerase sigma-70 factor (ECF subfamily)
MQKTSLNSLLALRSQFLNFVRRRVDDPAIAEDILQSAFLKMLESGDKLRMDGSAVAWFYRILRNAVIDEYRRLSVRNEAMERWIRELQMDAPPNETADDVACLCIDKALDDLTPNYSQILRAVDLGDTPLTDYAESHEITPGNAAVRVHRARAALKKQLEKSCGACAEHKCLDCTCRRFPNHATQGA